MSDPSSALLSVVVPVFNEAENIEALYERLVAVAASFPCRTEFVLVDDGSRDASFAKAAVLADRDQRIKVVRLARNFGSHGACLAGFSVASGDFAVVLSADLQDPPEVIVELLQAAQQGHDVVLGTRNQRDDGVLTRLFSSGYNRLMRAIAMKNWPAGGFDFLLVSRRVYRLLVVRPERNASIFGQILWMGFSQASVAYVRAKRHAGKSKWTLGKKVKLAIDSVVGFSYMPIRMISLAGGILSAIGLLYALLIVVKRVVFADIIEGWASLMCVVLVMGGVQMLMLGVIGEYLWRALDEVRERPAFLISNTAGFEEQAPPVASQRSREAS